MAETKLNQKQQDEIIKASAQTYIDLAVSDANKLWQHVKETYKNNTQMGAWSDDEKIDFFRKTHREFYTEFPIACRYMIVAGQYSNTAFRKYLKLKSYDAKNNMAKQDARGERTENWIKMEATYVKFLFQAYQKNQHDASEAKRVYKFAYESLTKEFNDFEKSHEEIKQRLDNEKVANKLELNKELLNRIVNVEKKIDGEETGAIVDTQVRLSDNEKIAIRDRLRLRLVVQNMSKTMKQLTMQTPSIDHCVEGEGVANPMIEPAI